MENKLKSLIAKYMELITSCEGHDYLDMAPVSVDRLPEGVSLSEDEVDELREIHADYLQEVGEG